MTPNTISTLDRCERLQESDADRLTSLYRLEDNRRLTPHELHEVKTLAQREAARQLMEAFIFAMVVNLDVEQALKGMGDAARLMRADDDTRRLLGYALAFRALLAAPEATIAAIRVLYDELLDTDRELGSVLRRLG